MKREIITKIVTGVTSVGFAIAAILLAYAEVKLFGDTGLNTFIDAGLKLFVPCMAISCVLAAVFGVCMLRELKK